MTEDVEGWRSSRGCRARSRQAEARCGSIPEHFACFGPVSPSMLHGLSGLVALPPDASGGEGVDGVKDYCDGPQCAGD